MRGIADYRSREMVMQSLQVRSLYGEKHRVAGLTKGCLASGQVWQVDAD